VRWDGGGGGGGGEVWISLLCASRFYHADRAAAAAMVNVVDKRERPGRGTCSTKTGLYYLTHFENSYANTTFVYALSGAPKVRCSVKTFVIVHFMYKVLSQSLYL
jgi:hypothetical protein